MVRRRLALDSPAGKSNVHLEAGAEILHRLGARTIEVVASKHRFVPMTGLA